MLERTFEVIFALIGVVWLINSLFFSFTSYSYLKKNLSSISNLLFGNPKYFMKLDLTNFFLIETTIGMIAAARFRELKILKREKVFSKGQFLLAPNLDDKNFSLFLKNHSKWYKLVVKNLIFSSFCLVLLTTIFLFFK